MRYSIGKAVFLSFWVFAALFGHALEAAAQTTASYAGTYAGTYSGADSGSFSVVISSGGSISASGSGDGGSFTGSGQVSASGSMQMTVGSVSTGSTFSGTINATTGALSGTWVNSAAGVNGSFSGSRTSVATTTTTTATTTTTVATTTSTTLAGGASGVPINLVAGWNLLGNSSAAQIDVPSTFGDPARITTVWKWNQAGGRWALYAPSMTLSALTTYAQGKGYDVLTSLAPKDGYWVNAPAAVSLAGPTASGVTLAQGDLQQGWNLVSSADNKTPSQLNQGLSSALGASGKAVTTLWGWDPSKGNWKFFAPSLEAQGGTALADYIASKNYLSFGNALSAAEGFWVNIGATTPSNSTTPPAFTSVAGYHSVLAIAANGDLWGWGNNSQGALGDGTKTDRSKAKLLGSGYVSVAISRGGESYSFGVKSDGTLLAWGADIFNTGAADVSTPQVIGTGFTSVSSNRYAQAAIKSDGSLWGWGINSSGLAGDGTTVPILTPKQIGTGFASVSVGTTNTMAVKQDGTLWAWGIATCGAHGPGSVSNGIGGFKDLKVPTQIGTGYKDAVTFATYSTIALKTDGTLWSWGQTGNGQLGDGVSAFNCRATPQQIGSDFEAIAGGFQFAIGLKKDGSVWSWGHLSISAGITGADSTIPKQVGTGFKKIFMNTWRAYAIADDGGLWAWGDSYDSGFANTFTYSPVPVKIN